MQYRITTYRVIANFGDVVADDDVRDLSGGHALALDERLHIGAIQFALSADIDDPIIQLTDIEAFVLPGISRLCRPAYDLPAVDAEVQQQAENRQ